MTGFVGFDPLALAALRHGLDDLCAEAARLTSADPEAVEALGTYGSLVASLAAWRTRIDRVLSCSVDGPVAAPGLLDVTLADVLHPAVAGWSLAADATAGGALSAGVRGARLAELVLVGFDEIVADTAQARALVAALGALGPDGANGFAVAIGASRFAELLDGAASATTLATAERGRPAGPGRVLDALGRSLGLAWARLDGGAWASVLAGCDPFTLGRLLRAAALPDTPMVALATSALHRWVSGGSALVQGQPAFAGELHPPRLLLEALTARPGAGRQVVAAWPRDRLERLLGALTVEGRTAGPFLAAIVDPRHATPSEAGTVLTAVLPDLRRSTDVVDPELHAWLGAAAAPWLDAFALGGVLGGAAWSWGEADPVALLDWVARSEDAADAVAVGAAGLTAARWTAVATAPDRTAVLYDLGVAVGTAQRAAGDGHVWVARRDDAVWHAAAGVPGALVSAASEVGGPAGFVIGVVTGQGAQALASYAQRHGTGGAPPPPERVERYEHRLAAEAEVDHAAAVARAAMTEQQRPGPPPPSPDSVPSGPSFVARFADAVDAWVADGGDAAARDDVHAFGHGFGDGFARLASAPAGG